jgi:hypothetical protein
MAKRKDKKLDGFITFFDPPADFIVTNKDDWNHAIFVIERTLKDFELNPKGAAKFYSARGLPFLSWIKTSLNCRIKNQNRTFAPSAQFEPTMTALEALGKLQGLLENNGNLNAGKAKVFLLSFQLLLSAIRSGIGLKEETRLHATKEIRTKRQTWHGLTKEQIEKRNQKIIDKFNNSKLSMNHFAEKYQNEFELKPSQIRTIIRNAKIK